MMHLKPLLAGLALLPLTLFAQNKSKPKDPPFVRLSLAGVRVDADDVSRSAYDPKSRYFLISTGDCDGASLDLILTPSPSISIQDDYDRKEDAAYLKNVRHAVLPHLRDGKGVNIGDTPAQVQRKLGAKPQQIGKRHDLNAIEWMYFAVIDVSSRRTRGPQNYSARYLFRGNHLWAIRYNLSEADGCD